MSRNEEFEHARYSSSLLDEVMDRDWFHGTTERGDTNIRAKGARPTFSEGVQTQGPGFYVFGSEDPARRHAADVAEDYPYQHGVVQSGHVGPAFPLQVTHRELEDLGRQFRDKNPRVSPFIHDAALGNIHLRQRGVDFLHITENHHDDPSDYGVVLRPGVWQPKKSTRLENDQ